jgi:hypothetical protein
LPTKRRRRLELAALDETELKVCRTFGKRLAEIAEKLK